LHSSIPCEDDPQDHRSQACRAAQPGFQISSTQNQGSLFYNEREDAKRSYEPKAEAEAKLTEEQKEDSTAGKSLGKLGVGIIANDGRCCDGRVSPKLNVDADVHGLLPCRFSVGLELGELAFENWRLICAQRDGAQLPQRSSGALLRLTPNLQSLQQ